MKMDMYLSQNLDWYNDAKLPPCERDRLSTLYESEVDEHATCGWVPEGYFCYIPGVACNPLERCGYCMNGLDCQKAKLRDDEWLEMWEEGERKRK